MKKRCIHGFAATYVMAAIIIAHTALATGQKTPSLYASQRTVVGVVEEPVVNSQRLLESDTETDQTDRSDYTITIWTASWCSKCPAYKARVQPALLKLGYTVVVKDWDKDSKERPQLQAVPVVCIHYKGEPISVMVAPTVDKVDKFVEDHEPKPEPEPEPEPEDDPFDLY